jgi:hypothetical protein
LEFLNIIFFSVDATLISSKRLSQWTKLALETENRLRNYMITKHSNMPMRYKVHGNVSSLARFFKDGD